MWDCNNTSPTITSRNGSLPHKWMFTAYHWDPELHCSPFLVVDCQTGNSVGASDRLGTSFDAADTFL